jgi:O-antigen ligase
VVLLVFVLVWSFSPAVLNAVHARAVKVVVGIKEPQIHTSVGQHVLDIVEAVRVIRASPIFGIGVGTYYETQIISGWKPKSYGVHNGFLNTWIKFGILGALAYLAMFVSFARSGWRVVSISLRRGKVLAVAPFGTAVGIWIMSFLFLPTPFESFQKSVLIFFCMATVYALVRHDRIRVGTEGRAHG